MREFGRLNKTFGERLRARRVAGGMTQEALATSAGISRTTINAAETGRQGVGVDVLYALADAMDIEPTDLLPSRSEARQGEASSSSLVAEIHEVGGLSKLSTAAFEAALRSTPKRRKKK